MQRLLCLGFLVALAACAPPKEAERVLVRTTSGPVAGVVGDGYFVFKGIPYAAAPWTKTRDGKDYGPSCNGLAAEDTSCLTLDVWAPVGRTGAAVSLNIGTGDLSRDGEAAARSGHVYVSAHVRAASATDDYAMAQTWVQANAAQFGGAMPQ